MNVEEARKLRHAALESQEGAVGQALIQIYQKIGNSAKQGLSSVDFESEMRGLNQAQRNAIKERLRIDGYKIESGGDQLDNYLMVSW